MELGRTLGLVTLAEGIEDHTQLEALRDELCDRGQGFILSRPVPSAEIEALLVQPASGAGRSGRRRRRGAEHPADRSAVEPVGAGADSAPAGVRHDGALRSRTERGPGHRPTGRSPWSASPIPTRSSTRPRRSQDYDVFGADRALGEAVDREGAGWARPELAELGALAGTGAAQELGRLANEHRPVLHTHDRYGHRIDVVEYHPAYHDLMRTSLAHGLHAGPWADPGPAPTWPGPPRSSSGTRSTPVTSARSR